MDFTIIIASFDRADALDRLLRGIAEHFTRTTDAFEVIVANNAREDGAASALDGVIARYSSAMPGHFCGVREPLAGKCRAQNRAISNAKGAILVFFDDDVEVTPEWLVVATKFFRDKPEFHAMQGPILMPPEYGQDAEFLRAHEKFRTINFVQYREALTEINTLTGANMAMRREVFDRVGLFNVALGPGGSGISEDVEFAQRMLRAGLHIGYEPAAGVIHEVDPRRLTEEFFRLRHEQQGRSRLIYKQQSTAAIVGNLLKAILQLGCYTVRRHVRKKYRAKGRYFHYRAMLEAKLGETSIRGN